MKTSDLISSAFASLRRTKRRSALAMLGIVIGILSVILMLSIGEAAQRFIMGQISSFGSDILFIASGPDSDSSDAIFFKESVTYKDAKYLKSLSWVTLLTGLVIQQDEVSGNGYNANVQVVATTPDEIRMNARKPALGGFITDSSVDRRSREVVLGSEVARELFGTENAVGKVVSISRSRFKVIGVMESSGTQGMQNIDRQVYIPITTGLDMYNKSFLIYITLKTSLPIREAVERTRSVMRDLHKIDNPNNDLAEDDFHIHTQEDMIKSANTITNILQILLTSIAAISLIVGGIGIMNIMYVSVTERIREIGLRKAVGATSKDVLSQFLLEALVLTIVGGVLGMLLGTLFSWLAIQTISQFQTGWSFAISQKGIFWGVSVSALIGIVFGYFPARRAARLHPIESLRSE